MSNITNAAVASINEQRKFEAQEKARRLILGIEASNHTIESHKKGLDELQGELKKLAHDRYNVVDIAGTLPSSVAAETITATINQLNKDEQDSVAERCTDLDGSIRKVQSALEAENKNREEMRKQLLAIKVEEVTVGSLS